MKTESDYLWDKTGEPDPEVQQLEEILGTLRYQPRPLEIPPGLLIGRERSFFRGSASRLAIAATIAMLVVGLGLWFGLQGLQKGRQPNSVAISNPPSLRPTPAPVATVNPNHEMVSSRDPEREGSDQVSKSSPQRQSGSFSHNARLRNQLIALKKRREAEATKDQLMLALRLASAKLTLTQKKTQNLRDEIHNQHKIG